MATPTTSPFNNVLNFLRDSDATLADLEAQKEAANARRATLQAALRAGPAPEETAGLLRDLQEATQSAKKADKAREEFPASLNIYGQIYDVGLRGERAVHVPLAGMPEYLVSSIIKNAGFTFCEVEDRGRVVGFDVTIA